MFRRGFVGLAEPYRDGHLMHFHFAARSPDDEIKNIGM